jgi:hypothetical protein
VFDLRVALQREAVVPAHAPLRGRASPAASATVRAGSVVRPSFPSPFDAERRSVRSGLPLLRFSRPFNVCEPCCAIRGGQPSDHPASTFDSPARRRRRSVARARDRVPTVFSPCVHRAWRAPRRSVTVHAGPSGSCAAVSLPRGVPLPSLAGPARPGRTASSSVRRRSWDLVDPSQCSLSAGPGVCDTTPASLVLSGRSPPFIPTCRYRPRSACR